MCIIGPSQCPLVTQPSSDSYFRQEFEVSAELAANPLNLDAAKLVHETETSPWLGETMSKPTQYHQCTLSKRPSPTASVEMVSFLPARYAKRGAVLKLKQSDESWDNGWVVTHVGISFTESEMPDAHRDIKNHRQTTGDALPRQYRC